MNLSGNEGRSGGLPGEFPAGEKNFSLYEHVKYDEYWECPARIRQNALEKHLISEMLPIRGRRIIDLGCGYGRLTSCYLDRFDQVVLYDGSMSLLRQARESVGTRAIIVAGDVVRLPFKEASFDTVLSIRVLQHLHDLRGAFQAMRWILARDGHLLFSYHNKRNAHRIVHYLNSRKFGNPFSLDSVEVSPTLLSHHPTTIGNLLHQAGFSEPYYRGAVVLNSLANATEKLCGRTPPGSRWASFTGKFKLAPWLIGRASVQGGDRLHPEDSIHDLFRCPACRGHVNRLGQAYSCEACRRDFPVNDGVADFRL